MQPKTMAKIDQNVFDNLKRTIMNMSRASRAREENPRYAMEIPEDVGIKLNNGCNLRCKHCYEWNEDGFHWDMAKSEQKREIDIDTIDRILAFTFQKKSKLYLWGGEPLYYSKFDILAERLEKDIRTTTICTNAILIEEKMDAILKFSEDLVLLVSLEGFEAENDAIRGKGTFKKVIRAIDTLLELQRKKMYRGKVSVSLTMNDAMIPRMFEFMTFFEEKVIDSVYFVYPWYISPESAHGIDAHVSEHLQWLKPYQSHSCSWHSFTYRISPDSIPQLQEEVRRISEHVWNIRVRFMPALEQDEIDPFVRGEQIVGMNRTKCLSISTRMDFLPNGDVTPCKFFPELSIGNIHDQSVAEVWHGENFGKHREHLSCGLMPICSRCGLLYHYGR